MKEKEGLAAFDTEDYAKAKALLEPLAEQGNAEAQCVIGNLYYQLGLGVAPDAAKAIAWYRKSAEQGYGLAANNLAGMLPEPEADLWYQKARDLGFVHAPTSAQFK